MVDRIDSSYRAIRAAYLRGELKNTGNVREVLFHLKNASKLAKEGGIPFYLPHVELYDDIKNEEKYTHPEFEFDPNDRLFKRKNGEVIKLTKKESGILYLLCKHPNKPLNRTHLLNMVWGSMDAPDARVVDIHIKNLRKKIELNPREPDFVRTKFGDGYYLHDPSKIPSGVKNR